MKIGTGGVLLIVASVAVAAAIVTGIIVLGPPSEERARRLDTKRVADLQQLTGAIEYYHQQKGRLPSSLGDLASLPNFRVAQRDPVSSQPYGFRVTDTAAYELCATFDRDSKEQSTQGREFWAHAPGTHCFPVKVSEKGRQ
jgi:hypothetical protein